MRQKSASDNADKSACIAADVETIDEAAIISLLFDQHGHIVDAPKPSAKKPPSSTVAIKWAERALSLNWDAVLSQPKQARLPMASVIADDLAQNHAAIARKSALKRIQGAKQGKVRQQAQAIPKSAKTHAEQQALPLVPRVARFVSIPVPVDSHGEPTRRLSAAEEVELILRAQSGDRVAMEVLIMAMSRILRMCASEVHRQIPNSSIEEMVQDGVIGVHRAIEKFDVTKGSRLSTYAAIWARSVMRRSAVERAKEQTPWNPLDIVIGDDGKKRNQSYHMESIDQPHDGDAFALRDTLANDDEETTEERAITIERRELLTRALAEITDDRMIAVARLRWLSDNPATLERIASLLGMSREGVRQIEVKALQLLKEILLRLSSDSFTDEGVSKKPQSPSGKKPLGKKKPAASIQDENGGDVCI